MFARELDLRISEADYLVLEAASTFKHEFFQGYIISMAGSSVGHNRITGNVTWALNNQLIRRGCLVVPNDLRVRMPGGDYAYPDVVALCDEPRLHPNVKPDTLLNPTLIIEVLSPATRNYDRKDKAEAYRAIPTLQHVLFIDPDRVLVHVMSRQADEGGWMLRDYTSLDDTIPLPALEATLALRDLYLNVTGLSQESVQE